MSEPDVRTRIKIAEMRLALQGEPRFDHTLPGWVYFVECCMTEDRRYNPVKIGWCSDTSLLSTRLKSLQTSNPFELRFVGFIPGGGVGMERYLHLRFEYLRMRGEWFLPGKDLLRFIDGVNEIHKGPELLRSPR